MALEYSLVHWLASGVVTTAGAAVASGKVRFYDPGTLTPHSVYSDAAGTSAIAQPITLSAGGRATVYTNAVLRCIIKDSTDTTTLFDTDINSTRAEQVTYRSDNFGGDTDFTLAQAYEAWSTSGAGGVNTPWAYRYSATANERTLKSWMSEVHVSVKDFGAVGDGVANDTTAIQSTITAVGAAGGGVVYFPPGTYLTNAALTMSSNSVSIVGSGIGSTTIKASGGAQNCFTCTSISSCRFEEFNVSHSSSSTGIAFSVSAGNNLTWRNVAVNLSDPTTDIFTGGSISITGASNYCRILDSTLCGIVSFNTTAVSRYFFIDSCYLKSLTLNGAVSFCFVGSTNIASALTFSAGLTGSGFVFVGNYLNSNPTVSVTSDIGLYWAGNQWPEARLAFAVGTTQNPQLLGGAARLTASSGGAGTVTVGLPATAIGSNNRNIFYITFVNASGGAVTWSMHAAYKLTAAIPTTDGHTIIVGFQADTIAGGYREVHRADTVT